MPAKSSAGAEGVSGDAMARTPVRVEISGTEERSSMLKNFTVYVIQVSDFGRKYQVERRFDDFLGLHSELAAIDAAVPPMPEKKMWASTDASTVAERKPAFERILQHALRSEELVFEKGQALWKFLELPAPGVVAARFVFKTVKLSYIRQCAKLLDANYEKEHAYRLAHEDVLRVNLSLLALDGALKDAKQSPSEAPEQATMGEQEPREQPAGEGERAGAGEPAGGAGAGSPASPAAPRQAPPPPRASSAGVAALVTSAEDLEAAVLDMLRWAVANGGELARKNFLEERGLSVMLNLLFRKAHSSSKGAKAGPDQRVRGVMNALLKAEGENFPKVFSNFLANGGVTVLCGVQSLPEGCKGFLEFVAKLLWVAWSEEVQQAFLRGSHAREALALLAALVQSQAPGARVAAGLLLASLLANGLLEGKEAEAADCLNSLVEEMVASSPAWSSPEATEGAATAAAPTPAEADLGAFVQGLGQREETFTRILFCADAPWRLSGGSLPGEGGAVWASCGLAFWCLLHMRPKAARLQGLRQALPTVALNSPPRVRWLAGELLLQLQLQGIAEAMGVGNSSPEGEPEAIVELTHLEREALELSVQDQMENRRQSLWRCVEQNSQVVKGQRALADERMQELNLLRGPTWHVALDEVLRKLGSVREELLQALKGTEAKSEAVQRTVTGVCQMELDGPDTKAQQMEHMLTSLREVESEYLGKRRELAEHEAARQRQDAEVSEANSLMEQADAAVQDVRKRIMELETKISSKQRDAQNTRTMVSSDFSALKGQVAAEMDQIKVKQAKLRERHQKLQAGELLDEKGEPLDATAQQKEVTKMKTEAAALKSRSQELQAEQQRIDTDPRVLEQQVNDLESEIQQLGQERDVLRGEMQSLEGEYHQAREVWRGAMSRLQSARQDKDMSERACSGLKQQLEAQWLAWKPLWSQRLQVLRTRMSALAQAQQGEKALADAVSEAWERLHHERAFRQEVLASVQQLQGQLSLLVEELAAIDDRALEG